MRRLLSHFAIFALALAAELTRENQVQAGLLASNGTVTSSGSNFTYSYDLSLTSNATLQTGDYFTVYDFQGLVSNSNTQPAGFTFSTSLVGPTPAGSTVVDSPSILNLTWTYNGTNSPVGPIDVGDFSAQSQYGQSTTGTFVSLAQRLLNDTTENAVTQSQVTVPNAPACDPSGSSSVGAQGNPAVGPTVAEPASLALFCLGLPLLGFFCFRRKQSSERMAA